MGAALPSDGVWDTVAQGQRCRGSETVAYCGTRTALPSLDGMYRHLGEVS